MNTLGFIATRPLTKDRMDMATTYAGFRPMESKRDPNAGEIMISVSAAVDPKMDRVDVARSDPIASIRAGAGENATNADDAVVRKDDVRNTDMSLRLQITDDDDFDCVEGDEADDAESSFFASLALPFVLLSFVEVDCIDFLFGAVDPPLTKMGDVVEFSF